MPQNDGYQLAPKVTNIQHLSSDIFFNMINMPGQNFRGFAERVALVTGGGSGVGRAVALQLALEGAYVIVNYAPRDAEGGRVAEELREMGTLAHAVEGDVSRAGDVRRVFGAVEDAYGRLDLLINAADLAVRDVRLEELSEEDWDTATRLTLKGTFLCAQAAAPLLRQRPRPAIVNVTAGAGDGVCGRGGNLSAVVAHAGVIGLTRAQAQELAPRVRVNCVAIHAGDGGTAAEPRSSSSGGHDESAPEEFSERRGGAPDEAARACVYLLSTDAAAITGQTLVVGDSSRRRP